MDPAGNMGFEAWRNVFPGAGAFRRVTRVVRRGSVAHGACVNRHVWRGVFAFESANGNEGSGALGTCDVERADQ
jgi:hypothetical protein